MFTGRLLQDLPVEIMLQIVQRLDSLDILSLLEIPGLIDHFCCYVYNGAFEEGYFGEGSNITTINANELQLKDILQYPILFAELKTYSKETLGDSIRSSKINPKKFIIYNGKYTNEVPAYQTSARFDQLIAFLPVLRLFVNRLVPRSNNSFSILLNQKNYTLDTSNPLEQPKNLKIVNIDCLNIINGSNKAAKQLRSMKSGHVFTNVRNINVEIEKSLFDLSSYIDFRRSTIENLQINVHAKSEYDDDDNDEDDDDDDYNDDDDYDDDDYGSSSSSEDLDSVKENGDSFERYVFQRAGPHTLSTPDRVRITDIVSDTLVSLKLDVRKAIFLNGLILPKLEIFEIEFDNDSRISKIGSIIAKNMKTLVVTNDRPAAEFFNNQSDFGASIEKLTLIRSIRDNAEIPDWPVDGCFNPSTYGFEAYNSVTFLDVGGFGIPFYDAYEKLTLKKLNKLNVRGTIEEWNENRFFKNFEFPTLRYIQIEAVNDITSDDTCDVHLTLRGLKLIHLHITGSVSWTNDTSDTLIILNITNKLMTQQLQFLDLFELRVDFSQYEFTNLKELLLKKVYDVEGREDTVTLKNNKFPKLIKLTIVYPRLYNGGLVKAYLPEEFVTFTGLLSKNCQVIYPSEEQYHEKENDVVLLQASDQF